MEMKSKVGDSPWVTVLLPGFWEDIYIWAGDQKET